MRRGWRLGWVQGTMYYVGVSRTLVWWVSVGDTELCWWRAVRSGFSTQLAVWTTTTHCWRPRWGGRLVISALSVCLCLSLCSLYAGLLHRFNALFSRTTWVSRHQKGKTSLDFYEARDDGVLGCSGISWAICKQSAPRFRQIATPTPHRSVFTGRMLFLPPNQQCQSTEGKRSVHHNHAHAPACSMVVLTNCLHVQRFWARQQPVNRPIFTAGWAVWWWWYDLSVFFSVCVCFCVRSAWIYVHEYVCPSVSL